MIKIINKTLSPYDLTGVDGPVRLPALGEVEGEFSGEYLELLEASNAVEIVRDHKPKAKAKAAAPAEPEAEADPPPAPKPKAAAKPAVEGK